MSTQRTISDKRQFPSVQSTARICAILISIFCLLGRSAEARGDEPISLGTESRLTDAFTNGLGEFDDEKTPAFLDVARYGRNWRLTGLDRNGASIERLQCLLCTDTEATLAAAHLGDLIGRRLRKEPPPSPPDASEAILSMDGAPVSPPLPEAEAARIDVPLPDRRPIRLRWAVAAATLGAAAFATGGVFLGLKGECASSDCRFLHEEGTMKGAGIGLIVTGALLETAAILLWNLKRKPKTTEEAP